MFLNNKQEKIIEVNQIKIKFIYPTISNEIEIESKKTLLTRGQYASLSISPLKSQSDILDFTDAIATLSVCAKFVTEPEKYYWEGFTVDEEDKNFVKEVYNEFLKWRDSFRKPSVKPAKE